ncbi:nSTAND1 domain-containing NTPase [Hydrogenophaga sp.]|uniref:nSTAND1 domain-containing NTPase n=1 Tax=Hydrogenophaga sp. TaxID=1904254 RepID=UPI002FC5B3C7
MYNQDSARIKAAMVIYAFEQDLGGYVHTEHTDINEDRTATLVAARIQEDTFDKGDVSSRQIIEATFLSEIFNLAQSAASKTADGDQFKRLRKIFDSLEITDIRNSVSHPNRPFAESYWHRVAALATDPTIEKIGFARTIKQYRLACEDRLTAPPEQWLEVRRSYIKNNLPDTVEHELTGLIGRDKDLSKLENELRSGRNSLVAIIARGGTGKTSLVLECLSRIVLKPETADWANAVIFCTLKQEVLTATGVVRINSPDSLNSLKNELLESLNFVFLEEFETIEDAQKHKENTSILLVIDNLETLLRDEPEMVGEFIDTLPHKWKVLVTSRLPVDAAKNIPLESLTRQSSLFLTRKYFTSRGHSSINAETLEKIGDASKDNPLAIRLIADLYIAGKDVDSAITVAANEITNYSFANLIDALSADAIKLLEGLFALGRANRSLLIDSLELSLDRIAAAIAQLAKTSLLTRTTDEALEEIYSIDESIRDLLRVSPKNIDVRRQVSANISRLHALKQEVAEAQFERKCTELDRDFIPGDTPVDLVPIVDKLNKAIRDKNALLVRELDLKLRQIEDVHSKSTFFYKQLVRIAYFFSDLNSQEIMLLKMLQIDSSEPYALLSLGYLYRSQQRLDKALVSFETLMKNGWGEITKSGKIAAISIHQGYLSALVFLEDCQNVLDLTNSWKAKSEFRMVYGVARAAAFRHLTSQNIASEPTLAREYLDIAVSTLGDLTNLEGSPSPVLQEQAKVIALSPLALLKINENSAKDRQSSLRILGYCHQHIDALQGRLEGRAESIKSRLSGIQLSGNPFLPIFQKNQSPDAQIEESTPSIPAGFELVEIYHIPNSSSFPAYMFGRDINKREYFLSVEYFQNGDWANWLLLKTGSKVAVTSIPSKNASTDYRATKIISV